MRPTPQAGADEPLARGGELLALAREGDGDAFRALVEPHRGELQLHCYRILGSVQDAEDLLQETLPAAWRGIGAFEGWASVRTWLYRIATNRCLNALRAGDRRPSADYRPEVPLPEPSHLHAEPVWLEPYPDVLLDGIADHAPGPEVRYEVRESVSPAFLATLQQLPPRQRVVLVLRDVLGFRAAEVAAMLDTTPDSVNGALKRARATMPGTFPSAHSAPLAHAAPLPHSAPSAHSAPLPHSARERRVVDAFVRAFEAGDVAAVVALLSDDVRLTMPPLPLAYQGLADVRNCLVSVAMRDGRRHRLVPTRANGQPAFGAYVLTPIPRAHGVIVLTPAGDRVPAVTRFVDNALPAAFGLPRSLRGDHR
ncbi:RNA polymerase subunit sigma-70 [Saccharothrix sp.]|uniref:RNA polymerase subunit sigma-70 n=1 Tax=Saccharothrix sp. TaxID=1873460 RepID=UPI002811292A|nr:RNA polymerase subunit sigma-70 [Saccharothrix sp.]